ncbi:hypothetical protein B566_EDAN002381 [Ephemera danica]|nr:hypothetical protein B566_EDAN002381 [Ephemera danica]
MQNGGISLVKCGGCLGVKRAFVNLVDCGHSIEVEGMKNWMAQNDDMVSKKSCPRCTKTISRSLRFGNDIKQSFFDICKVKKRLFGDARTIEEKRKELETKVKVLLQECTTQEYDELRWFLNETSKSLGYTVDKRRNVLSSSSIRCKEIEVDIVSRVCEVWQKSANLGRERREELQTHVNLILDNLEAKKHRLSQQQVIDFELEILRLQRILQYLAFKCEALTRPNLKHVLEKFEAVVLDFTKRYSLEKHQAANVLFNEMKELCKTLPGLGITDFERKSIVQALSLRQGHWFKCPNGHPYIITECGGAMHESTCNECGAGIGGGSHRLRDDNSHFRLMDGATHAAWSEQANLANYQFNFD